MKFSDKGIIFENEEEIPITAMSLSDTSFNKTGSWKYLEPYYQDLTPPCVERCLVGSDIVTWLRLTEEKRFEEAIQYIYRVNPFPAILGRVCPRPCETPCNRKAFGGGVKIRAVERFLGDYALAHGILPALDWVKKEGRGKIAIIGAGPAGLTSAWFLKLLGYDVEVFEKNNKIGGLLITGIPSFRLPKDVVEKELQKFYSIGITFHLGKVLGKDILLDDLRGYKAILISVGRKSSRRLNIAGEEHPQVFDGVKLLRSINLGEEVKIGEKILVIGGGNTTLDLARSLLRLGKKPVVLYRRTKVEMPAFKEEVEQAVSEGIEINFLVAPAKLVLEDNKLKALECVRTQPGELDVDGRRKYVPIEGSNFTIPCDAVVRTVGEFFDEPYLASDIALQEKGAIKVDDKYATSKPGVFACGDCITEEGSVGEAVKMGREAAFYIHSFISKKPVEPPNQLKDRGASSEVAKFKQFNMAYFRKEPPVTVKSLPPSERINNFKEIESGISMEEAVYEATRCFKCGTCVLCDNCRIFCPEMAIKLNNEKNRYEIDSDYCKGCGVCVEECPRGAIHMRKVVQ